MSLSDEDVVIPQSNIVPAKDMIAAIATRVKE